MKKKLVIKLSAVAAAAIVCCGLIHRGNVVIDNDVFEIKSEKIDSRLDGFTIVQLSDIHNANPDKFKDDFFAIIKEDNPDIIVVTGDWVSSYPSGCDNSIAMLQTLTDIADVYFVSGNHEAQEPEQYDKLKAAFSEYDVRDLCNESVKIEKNGASFNLIGIQDPILFGDMDKRRALIENTMESLVEPDLYNIILFHRPEYFDEICESGADLALCGHAHGGQFRLPLIGGLIAPGQGFLPEYTEGVYSSQKTQMVVSRGIGKSVIPFRINNHPEIVCVRLYSQ